MPDAISTTARIHTLKKLTVTLIDDALTEIRSKRPNSSRGKERRFRTADYFLLEVQDYVAGAWDMLAVGNVRASVAISRWILEAGMNLWWVVSNEDETEQHLADLAGEALRQDANLLDGLADLRPNHAQALRQRGDKARRVRADLGCVKLDSLETRMKDIKPPETPNWPDLYTLYRICCAAAHPGLRAWERFKKAGQATVSTEPSDNTILTSDMATWMAAASVLYLVLCAHCLTQTGNLEGLKILWNTKISPLLEQVEQDSLV